jgi:hypothetical protein
MLERIGSAHSYFFIERFTAMLYPSGSREQYRYDAVGNPVG